MKNFILIGLASFILASCSGSGLKTYGEYLIYDSMNTFGPVNLKIAINEISLNQFRAAVAKK